MSEPVKNMNDFIDGQEDCQKGEPADMKRSRDYQRGYMVEYEREQVMTFNSMRRGYER